MPQYIEKLQSGRDFILAAGFPSPDVAELLKASLWYVRQPAFEMGRRAIELLIDLIEAKITSN